MAGSMEDVFWRCVEGVMGADHLSDEDIAGMVGMARTSLTSKRTRKRSTTLANVAVLDAQLRGRMVALRDDLNAYLGVSDNRQYLTPDTPADLPGRDTATHTGEEEAA